MKKISAPIFALFLALQALNASAAQTFAAPRVALWSPGRDSATERVSFDVDGVAFAADALRSRGAEVALLNADELSDSAKFSAAKFDAFMLQGAAFPRAAVDALKKFADDGGVLVSLDAAVPFLIALEIDANGFWNLSPPAPPFAWQSDEILSHIGLKYIWDPARHSQGAAHSITPLMRKFAPRLEDFKGRLESRWVVPAPGSDAEYFPLIASRRLDGVEVMGPLHIVRNGKRVALVCASPVFLLNAAPEFWSHSEATLAAVVEIAAALRSGALKLDASNATKIDLDAPPAEKAPLDRAAYGEAEPDGAAPLKRWGKFDGSCFELLDAGTGDGGGLPPSLAPGARAALGIPLEARVGAGAERFLRVRGAITKSGAGLKITLGGDVLWNEILTCIDTKEPGNFSSSLADVPLEFTRVVFLPPSAANAAAAEIEISNPGSETLWLDAAQIEEQPNPRAVSIGLGAGHDGRNNYAADEAAKWGGIRMSLRTQWLGAEDDPKRFDRMDKQFNLVAYKNPRVEPILEGTPDWAAISPERLEEAKQAGRPTTVPPDFEKYARITRDVVERYKDRISRYEIWNEADIRQFWRGTSAEYMAFFKRIVPVIRELDPDAQIMPCGMAGYRPEFLDEMARSGVLAMSDMLAFHPYAGKSPAWDIPFGRIEGHLFSKGSSIEIYCNESGFPDRNQEWFTAPPAFNEATQARLIDTAIARLLANGLAKLSIFNAGGDNHGFGLIRADGSPKPAYEVFADYARLNGDGAHRLPIALALADGSPLEGVYAAASRRPDGAATIIINPAENPSLNPPAPPSAALNGGGGWTCFFGSVAYSSSTATITPDPGKSAGFYKHFEIDKRLAPKLSISVGGAEAEWELLLKTSGKTIPAIPRRGAGEALVDLSALLPDERADVEFSFRIHKGPATINSIAFSAESEPSAPARLDLILRVPGAYAKAASSAAPARPISRGGWTEIHIPISARAVLELLAPPPH